MDTANSDSTFEDGRRFVIETYGDSMWDEVLDLPAYNASLRPPLPAFTLESPLHKVQMAEDTWNTKDSVKVSLAYTTDTEWRNRTEFIHGRDEVKAFLAGKWTKE